ncbi:MAG: tRNA (adenosine(37)-N6)-threonylcarbamoyltransferase complex dimerization subunit type 1 TsaB, partial [Deltaproteobacteria bacterium]|nr:tRNA (adenosine(37)-N6)-threonylcarbamoyltransferase complex dimerization subunit type 1 TsaB [Deltaproteobacteria bacterium]
MKILAFDTTTRQGSVALAEDDLLIAEEVENFEITHTERLLPSIDRMLRKAGWQFSDVEGLAVSIGPGSFTGLRIGLAAAKAFALANQIPLVGVSSLLALACNALPTEKPIVPILDAKRGEVYAAVYVLTEIASLTLAMTVPEQAIAPEKLEEILKQFPTAIRVEEGAENRIHSGTIAKLALPRLKNGEGREWAYLTPNYLRLSDAVLPK